MPTLKQAMSYNPTTARCKDDLVAAYFRMKREGFRHLLVIDDQGDLAGIISDRDFQRAMWPINSTDAHGLPDNPNFPKDAKVAQYMTWPVAVLSEDATILDAVNLMTKKKISAVAVMRGGQIAGVLTHEDLLRVLAVILEQPAPLAKQLRNLSYRSPLNQIANLLSAAGI